MTRMSLTTDGETNVIVRRSFAAAPDAVYRAHVEPALIQQWLSGPEGWRMTECRSDPRAGGQILFRWQHDEGNGFHLTGEYLDIEPGRRIRHVERMFLPDPTPDNHVETLFQAKRQGTLIVMTMTLPDAATRKAMLDSGMANGMEAGYLKLETLLA